MAEQIMNQKKQISPAQRAQLFAQTTRQHWKMDGAIAGAANSTVKFTLNKVRLTNRVRVEVSGTVNATHATNTSFTGHDFAPFTVIRRVTVDMNNGFSPFIVEGKELLAYLYVRDNAGILTPASSGRNKVVLPKVASAGGTNNNFRFLMDLPLALNDRDPVSMLVTQNQQTTVTVTVDIGNGDDFLASSDSGYTMNLSSITLEPMQESFSIPAIPEARPDIGILKLVQSTKESIAGSGTKTIKLPTGMTYRKLAFLITDSNGDGFADSAFSGNFELVLNQSDIPYSVKPSVLAAINHEQFGTTLPNGLYAFDFSYQGLSNYGGMRDYIDTEQLTEFWLRFNAPAAGEIFVVYEVLSKLRQQIK